MPPQVTVYGADWCFYTREAVRYLNELGVSYRYVDTDTDTAASQWVKDHNDGLELKPTLDVGGVVLSAPTASQLESTLREAGLLPARAA
jgi:glutaredoxin